MAIHPLHQEGPQLGQVLDHVWRKGHQGARHHPHVLRAGQPIDLGSAARLDENVPHHGPDHSAHGLQAGDAGVEARMVLIDLVQDRADQRHVQQLLQVKQARLHPIVHVVIVIGDVVGKGRHLSLGRGPGRQPQAIFGVELGDGAPRRAVELRCHRAIVLDHSFQGLPGQVQPVPFRIAALELGHHPEGLDVVVEPAIGLHEHLQLILAGMTERGMAQVVGERDGLGEINVQAERRGQGPRDLRHLQGVGQPGSEVIALMGHEDLGLLLQPPEGGAMDDAVPIPGERGAGGALGLGDLAPQGGCGIFGVGDTERQGGGHRTLHSDQPLGRGRISPHIVQATG